MSQPQETAYCFYCHPVSLLQVSSVQEFIYQASHGQAVCGKVDRGKGRCGLLFRLASLQLAHWARSEDWLLPREMGQAVETAPTDLTAFHPQHLHLWSLTLLLYPHQSKQALKQSPDPANFNYILEINMSSAFRGTGASP